MTDFFKQRDQILNNTSSSFAQKRATVLASNQVKAKSIPSKIKVQPKQGGFKIGQVLKEVKDFITQPRDIHSTTPNALGKKVIEKVGNIPLTKGKGKQPTVGEYVKGQVVNPIKEGVKTAGDKKKSGFERVVGGVQAAGGAFSATPVGAAFNVATGTAAGVVKTIRKGGDLQKNVNESITKPTSIASEGLGVGDKPIMLGKYNVAPLVAAGVDLGLTRNPKSTLKNIKSIKNALVPVKHGVERAIAHQDEIVDVLKRYEDKSPLMNTPDGKLPQPDIKLHTDADHLWRQIFGGNKKPPASIDRVVADIKIGLRSARTEVQMKSEGIKMGLVSDNPKVSQVIEQTAKQVGDKPPVTKRVFDSIDKVKTNIVEYVQNTDERVRKLVNRKDVQVDDISDPYLKATLYPGRVAEKVNQGKAEAESIINDIKKTSGEFKTNFKDLRKTVNDYLYYRHAPERNAALGENAAGITTKNAETGKQIIEGSAQGKKVKELADRVSKLNEQTLDLLKGSGVITDELYDTLRTKYKNHVPLNRIFEETDDVGGTLGGQGFDVKSTGIKSAKGSSKEVDDILGNVVSNYEQAVLRSEKNIVDQATLNFARKNKDILGDLFHVSSPKAIGTTFEGKPLLDKTNDPSILQMYENGKKVWIKINDPHLAVALRGVGREKLGTLLNAVGSFTRLYSGLATRFNPEFALPNKLRDLQETAVYLASQKGVGFKGAAGAVTRDAASVKDIVDHLAGKDTQGAKLYKQLKELGGTTGGFGLSTRNQVELNLKSLEKLANSKTRRIGDNLIKYVDNWNTVFEDSTRLSVFKQALDQKLSPERAAFLAKEASINFNRMGKGGPVINALWMFSNASIQGTTKMIRALKNPKVLGATVAAVGSSVAAVNQWNDQVDPDWRDKVSKWDRLNGLPVVLPNPSGEGVKYMTIPVSWGIKPIKVMADYAYDASAGKGFNAKDMVNNTMTSILEAYNPVGGTDLTSAATPTLLDVPSEIARNQSWSGSKIKPDYNASTPEDIKYFESLRETKTGQTAISISEMLQSKSNILVSPANIKYAFDAYVGGAGRAVSKTVNTITGVLGQKPVKPSEYPIVSRFYREKTDEEVQQSAKPSREVAGIIENQTRQKFKNKEQIKPIYDKVQQLKKQGKDEEAQKIVDSLGDAGYEAYKSFKTADTKKKNEFEKKKMQPIVLKVQSLKQKGNLGQAQKIVDQMSDDEYDAYVKAKKQLGIE